MNCVCLNLLKLNLQHLKEEGHNPEKFTFEVADAKTPSKRTKRTDSTIEQEETPAMEDMIVQDDVGEEDEGEQQENSQNNTSNQTTKKELEKEKPSRKRENHEEPEAAQPKKPCIDKDSKSEEDQKNIENNLDTEDSINLDLGEDELLNEEVCFYFFSVTVKLPVASTKMTNGIMMMEVD